MNDDAFEANLRRLMDAHVERSVVFYRNFHNSLAAYLGLARSLGISEAKIREVITNENQRISDELDQRLNAVPGGGAPQVFH